MAIQSHASQDDEVYATGAEWTFGEDSKVAVKMDPKDARFKSIHFKIKGNSIDIPEAEFKDLPYPDLSTVLQVKIVSIAETGGKTRYLRFQYMHNNYPWGDACSEVTFYFSDTAYLSREVKTPTGKGTWEHASKENGKPQVRSGTGGTAEGIK